MKEEEIRRLVKIVEESNIGELEVSRWGRTIKISKFPINSHPYGNSAPASTASVMPAMPVQSATAETKPPEAKPQSESKKAAEIKAPMVGTFYRSPAPDADPYVEVSQVIKKGQVVCIIEAMKLMNEIEAELDGRIVEVLVENGQPVEYNQPLFRLEQN
jgi:acetyl-CoA carboxylase biotin carboxyl carrier protein